MRAPLVQMLLTAQFQPALADVTMLDIAQLFELYRERFTEFSQVDVAGPMIHSFAQLQGEQPVVAAQSSFPRVRLGQPEGGLVVLFQGDRFSAGWERKEDIKADISYVGFDQMLEMFQREFRIYRQWIAERKNVEIKPLAVELTYTSAFTFNDEDGNSRRLSSMFTLVNGELPFATKGFDFSWNEPLAGDAVLSVQIVGPTILPPDVTVAVLNLTATFPVPLGTDEDFAKLCGEHHDRLTQTYVRLVKPNIAAKS